MKTDISVHVYIISKIWSRIKAYCRCGLQSLVTLDYMLNYVYMIVDWIVRINSKINKYPP